MTTGIQDVAMAYLSSVVDRPDRRNRIMIFGKDPVDVASLLIEYIGIVDVETSADLLCRSSGQDVDRPPELQLTVVGWRLRRVGVDGLGPRGLFSIGVCGQARAPRRAQHRILQPRATVGSA